MSLTERLNQPDREFTPIPFWFLNGDLKDREIRRQMEGFSAHGVYGVVLHPRMGLSKRIGYLSKTFFHYIKTAVKEAKRLDMKIVLYDEGMYPSGSACGLVTKGHPELASEGIVLTDRLLEGDELLADTALGKLAARKSGGTLRGIHWGEDDGEANAPQSADILNQRAVDRFIALTHEQYYYELEEYFGSTIIGFFTDEPSILGRNTENMFPWTHGFAAEFTSAGGKAEELAGLFSGEENASVKLYHRMIAEREGRVYYGSLSRWCEAHGIALMGHPHESDDIEAEKYFHIPGQDLVLRRVAPEKNAVEGVDSTMGKCSADAAVLMNRRRNSNECFGACNREDNPWQLSGGDIKWYLDWLAVRGVNLFIPHAFYYSIAGKRKEERPPDVGPNSMWWPWYRSWAVYMSRLSCLMTDAELHASVAVLCGNRDLKPELTAELYRRQISFQYLPGSVWPACRVENGRLICQDRQYDVLLGDDGNRFPGVCRDIRKAAGDCFCNPPAPELRCAHITRDHTQCWFLVNEGEKEINTEITLPVKSRLGSYDLWTGRSYAVKTEQKEQTVCTKLSLPRRGSFLLFCCTEEEYEKLEMPVKAKEIQQPAFVLESESGKQICKNYTAQITCSAAEAEEELLVLTIEAEEMAELKVNGVSAGVSFWSPHRFEIQKLVREGLNQLDLTVYGSLANRYGRAVPYGLGIREFETDGE